MIYKSMMDCIYDLEKNGHLIRIKDEIHPELEAAEIHRRIYEKKGPAVLFENLSGTVFPAVSNLFGTSDRARFIFRDTLPRVKKLIGLKTDPFQCLKSPLDNIGAIKSVFNSIPVPCKKGPVCYGKTTLGMLPKLKCWPDDGGAFILLPQVYSENPLKKGIMHSNTGMYRIQITGNEYEDNEAGLHYQIKRDIGIHHMNAIKSGQPLKISVFVGGPPAHTLAAVMPLPENIPEILFAGALAGRNFRYMYKDGYTLSLDADFCITGTVEPNLTKPEGPFGDHLGYYSLTHDFPYMKVDSVYYRKNAVWPFTVVGRPPQEDSVFGEIIHELTEPAVPDSIPGVEKIHAVDASGVHPLLLAIGRESYQPYGKNKALELLTLSHTILGYGQCSLAKYLFLISQDDAPVPDVYHEQEFFSYVLERVDFKTDLHFHTHTSMDTLDYTGGTLNSGSKLVCIVRGEIKRSLSKTIPVHFTLPPGFKEAHSVSPGILIINGPACKNMKAGEDDIRVFLNDSDKDMLAGFPLIIIADDSEFTSRTFRNFLWVTFTRSNPSHDVYGIDSFTDHKHWGCRGSLVIDARMKPHHAHSLTEDPDVTNKIDRMFRKGGSLYGVI